MSDIEIRSQFAAFPENKSTIPFEIEFTDPKHQGLSAKFRIRKIVNVFDSSPENDDIVAYEHQFMIASRVHNIDVPASNFPRFGYKGSKIEIICQAEVVVDDAIFFDSKIRTYVTLKQLKLNNQGLASNPSEELNPHDQLNFIRNFAAISFKQKIAWITAFVTFILAAVGNLLLALFDTFIASVPIFYSADSENGLVAAGMGAVAGGVGFSAVHKTILRSYKTAELVRNPPTILKGTRYRVSDFLTAKSKVHLYGVTLRLVVATLECGQYWRGSGTSRRCVSFSHPSRALVLFEKTTAVIPKGVSIETYFNDQMNLDKAFECIFPNNMISDSHGLKIKTEIQIMVDDLADTSLELPQYIRTMRIAVDLSV